MPPRRPPPPERDPSDPHPLLTDRGRHPDLDDNGQLLPDAHLPVQHREFNRRWRDPVQQAIMLRDIARHQQEWHPSAQAEVEGRAFGDPDDPYDGYAHYRQLAAEYDQLATERYGPAAPTPRQVAAMSEPEMLQWELGGKPLRLTPGSYVDTSSTLDPWTAAELQRARERRA